MQTATASGAQLGWSQPAAATSAATPAATPVAGATSVVGDLSLQQLEEAWTLRMEQPLEQLEAFEAHLSQLIDDVTRAVSRI